MSDLVRQRKTELYSSITEYRNGDKTKKAVKSGGSTGTSERSEQWGIRSSPHNEWGFSNKMIDLTRHIDKARKA